VAARQDRGWPEPVERGSGIADERHEIAVGERDDLQVSRGAEIALDQRDPLEDPRLTEQVWSPPGDKRLVVQPDVMRQPP
jgi:hypothetical protein